MGWSESQSYCIEMCLGYSSYRHMHWRNLFALTQLTIDSASKLARNQRQRWHPEARRPNHAAMNLEG